MSSAIQKLQEKRANGEEGFTLIELLVVIIIIGILAAIAIPVFLNQREKGWDAQAQSDVRNAAVIQETIFTDTGSYGSLSDMTALDWTTSADTTFVTVTGGGTTAYCVGVTSKSGQAYSMSSTTGSPVEQAC